MKGFYCKDEEVVAGFDTARGDGKKSEIYESGSAKGLAREDFENFLDYAYLVSEQAEKEMREGNITPSPYEGTCKYCKLLGMCGFTGEPRKERKAGCTEIVRIVKESAEGEEK